MIDVRGVELTVGQTVAFADRDGNVARMRSGVIAAVDEATQKVTIVWDLDFPTQAPKQSTVSVSGQHVYRPRICVVTLP